jgi:hypothetical protein
LHLKGAQIVTGLRQTGVRWTPRDTPIWKLEAALKCRSCRKGRYAPPVHMIKLTMEREIAPYVWVDLILIQPLSRPVEAGPSASISAETAWPAGSCASAIPKIQVRKDR